VGHSALLDCAMASGGGPHHAGCAAAPSSSIKMRDTPKHCAEIIEHLEKAFALSNRTSEAVVGYLIERALDATWVRIGSMTENPWSAAIDLMAKTIFNCCKRFRRHLNGLRFSFPVIRQGANSFSPMLRSNNPLGRATGSETSNAWLLLLVSAPL
jgi:hypothetical protein